MHLSIINMSIHQYINQLMHESINAYIDQASDRQLTQSIDRSIDPYISQLINKWNQLNIHKVTSHQLTHDSTQSTHQSFDQSIDQTSKQSINGSIIQGNKIVQPTSYATAQSINEATKEAINQPNDSSTHQPINVKYTEKHVEMRWTQHDIVRREDSPNKHSRHKDTTNKLLEPMLRMNSKGCKTHVGTHNTSNDSCKQ